MAGEDQEEETIEVTNSDSNKFTHDELLTALHEMSEEYMKLFQSFEKVKTERETLSNQLSESNCLQQKELNGLRVELNLLATENDNMRKVFQAN